MRKQSKIAFCIALTLCFLLFLSSCGTSLRETPLTIPLETYVYEGLNQCEEIISFSPLHYSVTEEDLRLAFSRLLASRWDLFFVCQEYTLKKEGDRVLYMRPQYRFVGEELLVAKKHLEGKLNAILAGIPPTFSPLETVFYLHDHIITHFSYDDAHKTYDLYEMLETGKGVCQAYTLLFKALCERVNIPCEVVLCFPKQHEWNLVKLYGNWYHIDLTWDETELPYLNRVPHPFMLLDDQTLRERRQAKSPDWQGDYGWESPHAARDTTFSRLPLNDVNGKTECVGGTLYLATKEQILALDTQTLTTKVVFSYPKKDEGYSFVTLVLYQDSIYFNLSSTLWRITGDAVTSLGSPLPDGVYYYGLAVKDNTLLCQTKH